MTIEGDQWALSLGLRWRLWLPAGTCHGLGVERLRWEPTVAIAVVCWRGVHVRLLGAHDDECAHRPDGLMSGGTGMLDV